MGVGHRRWKGDVGRIVAEERRRNYYRRRGAGGSDARLPRRRHDRPPERRAGNGHRLRPPRPWRRKRDDGDGDASVEVPVADDAPELFAQAPAVLAGAEGGGGGARAAVLAGAQGGATAVLVEPRPRYSDAVVFVGIDSSVRRRRRWPHRCAAGRPRAASATGGAGSHQIRSSEGAPRAEIHQHHRRRRRGFMEPDPEQLREALS